MRRFATCYNDHAVKVSDSYCSAYPNRSYLSPRQITSTQNAVASTYKAKLSPHKHFLVTITWSTKPLCRGFWFNIADSYKAGSNSSPPLRMGAEKGKEIFGACGSTVQVYWDLSNAKFDGPGPEPVGSFYVVVLIDSLPGLLLGDMGEEEEDPFVGRLPTVKPLMVSRCEHLSGSTHFSTWAKFCDSGQAHEVVIRCGADVDGREGPNEGPVLSVLIDKRRVVRITRLKWNFRGNQLVFVDGLMVDVMWDLHRWMREDQGARDGGYDGVFMFRTRSGLNSRLWFEEKKLAEENHDKVEFSFLVCATRNPV